MSAYLTTMKWLTDAAILVGVISSIGFLWIYRRTDWRRHEMGWHIMAFTTVIMVLLALGLVNSMVLQSSIPNQWPGQPIVRFASFAAVAALVTWRWALIYRAQKPTRDEGSDEATEGEPRLGDGATVSRAPGDPHLRERQLPTTEGLAIVDPVGDRRVDGGAHLRGESTDYTAGQADHR